MKSTVKKASLISIYFFASTFFQKLLVCPLGCPSNRRKFCELKNLLTHLTRYSPTSFDGDRKLDHFMYKMIKNGVAFGVQLA